VESDQIHGKAEISQPNMISTFNPKEFYRRRKELMALMDEDSIAILPAALIHRRNGDVDFPYRQDSDFYYLTGFAESDSVFVLVPGREHGESILFCKEEDPDFELWHGKLTGPERACQLYGFDDAFPIADIDDILPGLIEGKDKLYYAMGVNREFDNQIIDWVNAISSQKSNGAESPGEFIQLGHLLHELRLFKSKDEIALMQEAADITARAHRRAMTVVQPGMTEYQLEAELLYEFGKAGARCLAYPSIVGAGHNSCVLHYLDNRGEIRGGDLVLIDAGCEYEYYAADVTRTFPASGKFDPEQRQIYEIVLRAQKAAIECIKPGNEWNQPHKAAVRVITQGLMELGLLEGELDSLIATEACQKFYMHKTGHWIGLDVHDVGEYKIDGAWRVFEPGMVTTVEPAIYIPESIKDVPERWHGIGIRIEDDVLVTASGNKVLSHAAPKEIDAIEALMSGS
jgi:Xaa-Pro aminopeptidase